MKTVIILVEGQTDKNIVSYILEAAKIPQGRVNVIVTNGRFKLTQISSYLPLNENVKVTMLVDLDINNLPDAKEYLDKRFSKYSEIEILYAIPSIEAWLFADNVLAKNNARNLHAKKILDRISFPDEIVYPKQIAYYLFKNYKDAQFLKTMDISRATSKSPSLYNFLTKISQYLEIDLPEIKNPVAKNIDRRVIANLLNEIFNSDTIVFKSSNGKSYSVREMIENIKNETALGKEYTNDLLKIARDLLVRKAKKNNDDSFHNQL